VESRKKKQDLEVQGELLGREKEIRRGGEGKGNGGVIMTKVHYIHV
jgi:hypothetical protein